jgi:hypothetical protein
VNCISICCAARSSTAQPCDTSLNNFIRLGLGAVLRASVRRHRSRLILGCFGRSDRRAQTRPGIVPTSPDSRGWQLDTGQPARGRVGSHRENEDTTSSAVPSEFSRRFLFETQSAPAATLGQLVWLRWGEGGRPGFRDGLGAATGCQAVGATRAARRGIIEHGWNPPLVVPGIRRWSARRGACSRHARSRAPPKASVFLGVREVPTENVGRGLGQLIDISN